MEVINETEKVQEIKFHKTSTKTIENKEYQITDTINIDLNGNGIIDNIYFDNNDCIRLVVKEKNLELISLGCGNNQHDGFPSNLEWVNTWSIVYDNKVWEVLFKDNGDIDKDTIITLERPSLYIGKKDGGGGIITYRDKEFYWVHQSD